MVENIEMFRDVLFYTTIGTAITRLGAVLLIIFGVQILITLYKYNIRLSAFYDARADALELVESGDPETLRSLVSIISPDSLDFPETPHSPSRDAVDLVKEITKLKG